MMGIEHEQREEFVKAILSDQFGRQVLSMTSLGRDSNNFVLLVTLEHGPTQHTQKEASIGAVPLPDNINQVVTRISNPAAMLDDSCRIQNEVAALNLGRDALSSHDTDIVPEVYGWSPASSNNGNPGWILQSVQPGKQLSSEFKRLSPEDQKCLLHQLADIFKLIQSYELPSTIKEYGGLGYDSSGNIVSGPMTFGFGGPFASVEDMYKGTLQKQLQFSETSDLLNGWHSSTLRARIEKFAADGVDKIVEALPDKRKTFIHGDFDFQNILYDPETMKITGLLDFDFAHVASPVDEYFYSFPSIHSLLSGPYEGGMMEELRQAILSGNYPVDQPSSEEVDWKIAQVWNQEMKRAGVIRPSDEGWHGIEEYAALFWFIQDVCPPYLLMPRWVAKRTPEQLLKAKQGVEAGLEKYLERWGY